MLAPAMSDDALHIEFLFDFASPYSYLAEQQIDAVAERTGMALERVPIYLRGLETFRNGMPYSSAKLAYMMRDLVRTAGLIGADFSSPATFPINGLYLLRGQLWLEADERQDAYRRAAWRATWAEGESVSSAEDAAAVAESAGISREEFLAGISDPAVKERLKANTERAVERGVFGAPTFFLGEQIFFGQDRLSQLEQTLTPM
jgi:2-hydroxychromene-2-carboxylate isomerase